MKKTSTDSQTYLDRIRSWTDTKAHGSSSFTTDKSRHSVLPIANSTSARPEDTISIVGTSDITNVHSQFADGPARHSSPKGKDVSVNLPDTRPSPAASVQEASEGSVLEPGSVNPKKNIVYRFGETSKSIILSSWVNVLLVFVPVGIASELAGLDPTIIFSMNAIAIIPLAGLLSHATESVAKRMGDTIGALMNVTFGNAVELIIFIIALVKNDIRIVQASLLGSILSNLLLILGMSFLVGGLRYREQVYNSTVTQMSACLLSLAVMSLLLPTAFHASFADTASASATINVLKLSRGTSVVLLLVYVLYLVFQLKSHAYMYESTPQHIIDEESAPGPVAAWMESSSDSSSGSSSSDSDDSSRSNKTARRIKRVMLAGRRRRKSSASKDTDETALPRRISSDPSGTVTPLPRASNGLINNATYHSTYDAEADDEGHERRGSNNGSSTDRLNEKLDRIRKKKEKKERKRQKRDAKKTQAHTNIVETTATSIVDTKTNEKKNDKLDEKKASFNHTQAIDFAVGTDLESQSSPRKAFLLGGLNLRPAIPRTFSQGVFATSSPAASPRLAATRPSGPIPHVRYGIRRTSSLPDRLNLGYQQQYPATSLPTAPPILTQVKTDPKDENISRTTAVVLLLVSTGLVAVCAEFMVDSIQAVTTNTSLGETFVGLIILPIVGNAAEHVTAVTVAHKNKMDLAIGVAVGSSIQMALFVTPFVVLLGWIMDREMSLYFTLFETVSLFVSAFIVNFLVLDGRSNYLEGALLCAAYVIIAVAAFFYPATNEQSVLGGKEAEVVVAMFKRMVGM